MSLGDRPAVLWVEREGLEDEKVERALGEVEAVVHFGPFALLQESIAFPCRSAREPVASSKSVASSRASSKCDSPSSREAGCKARGWCSLLATCYLLLL